MDMWLALEKKLADWEADLAQRMDEKESEKFRQVNRKWLEATLPQIEREERTVSLRLQKLEELIAKTKMLIADVNEDLCRELTGGDGLAAVRAALVEQFGNRLMWGYGRGRKTFRATLEKRYHIDAKAARELFALLEETKIVRYVMEPNPNVRTIPASYYPEEAAAMAYNGFYGEPPNVGEPPLRVFWDIG